MGVIDLPTGNLVGTFEFIAGYTEIYDIHLLPLTKISNLLPMSAEAVRQAFSAPEFSYWLRPKNVIPNSPAESLRC